MYIEEKRNGQATRERILEFIKTYIEAHCYPPSMREIGKGVGLSSSNTVWGHMQILFALGELERDGEGRERAYRVKGYKMVKG